MINFPAHRPLLAAASLSVLACCTLRAAEPPEPPAAPKKPFRPYPVLPNVLWYEDFELAQPALSEGKEADNPQQGAPGKSFELGDAGWGKNDKARWMVFKPQMLNVKFPDGLKPSDISISFNVWLEEDGEVIVKATHSGGDYNDSQKVSAEKKWFTINLKMADMRNKASRPEAAHVCDKLEIHYKPRSKKEYKKAYVDDLIIATGVPKASDLLPRVQVLRQQVVGMIRTIEKDGYNFSEQLQNQLKASAKAAGGKRNKSVLVFGPSSDESAAVAKGLTAGASKAKLSGTQFVLAESPDGSSVGGLADLRTLLLHNLAKSDSEVVLIVMTIKDSKMPGRPSDALRTALLRTVEHGSVPMVVLPGVPPGLADKERKDLETYQNTVRNVCLQIGAIMIDPAVATKGVDAAYSGSDLTPAGLEALGTFAASSVRHTDQHVFGRK